MNSIQSSAKKIILVTGAARSGKSEWAETLAATAGKPAIYVATARTNPRDSQWQARIERHRLRRPAEWQTLEVPIDLISTINRTRSPNILLIDSLGTWVANLLEADNSRWQQIARGLLESLTQARVDIILVAEETGWGVVPAFESGREFRDRLGSLIRQIGAIADTVYLVTGGHALDLTLLGHPLNKPL